MLSAVHIVSIVCTLFLASLVGLYSLRKIKSADDFTGGNRSMGATIIIGTIVGTIIGGSSTVGTAQLAFQYGFSAWWMTLGCGISCLILGIFMAKPLYNSGATTVPGLLAAQYGESARTFSCLFSTIGIFLSIVAQILSAIALITSTLQISPFFAAALTILLAIFYVIFGGIWSTGLVGIFKVILIYTSMIVTGLLAYQLGSGLTGFRTVFPAYPWFSLLGRSVQIDLAAGFSLLVGVLSTQIYLQAIFSGKSLRESRKGVICSGLMVIPIGLAAIMVGLYMRANFPNINPAEALPTFILKFLPPWLGGVVLAAILISIVGSAAGLLLGISTMVTEDIYKKFWPQATDKSSLLLSRAILVLISVLALLFVSSNLNSLILKWIFLSMGIRGSSVFFPLLLALFFKDLSEAKAVLVSILAAPLCSVIWTLAGLSAILEPLYVGLAASLLIIAGGIFIKERKPSPTISKM